MFAPTRFAIKIWPTACLFTAIVLMLTGCASGPKTFQVKGEADSMINRDAAGNPLSVAVRLYQLKEADEFSKLTFDTLASGRHESELLGADLLEKNEIILVPGGKYVGAEKFKEDAKYIGVVAFFREPDRHYWRFLVDAAKVRSEGFSFRVQDCYLMLENLKPAPIPGQPAELVPSCRPDYRPSTTTPIATRAQHALPASMGGNRSSGTTTWEALIKQVRSKKP